MKNRLLKEISIIQYFWLCIIALFTIVTSLYIYLIWQHNLGNSTSILKNQSSRIEKSFIDSTDYTAYLMKHINSQIEEHNSSDLKYIKNLLSSFALKQNDIPWNMFSWFDKDLRLVVNSEKGIVKPLNSGHKPYLQNAFKNPNQIRLGKAAYGRLSGDLIIPAGMAVAGKNGEIIGGLIFGLQIKKLIHNMTNSINEIGVEFAFFDQDHQMMFNSKNFINYENISNNLALNSKNNHSGLLTKFSFLSRKSTLNYYQEINKHPYFIVTQYDRELFEKNLISKILPYFFELLLILLTLCVLVFLFKKYIINPILQLALVSEITTIDHDDKDFILPKSRIPEINKLSGAIRSIEKFIKNEKSLNNEIQLSNQKLKFLTRSVNHDLRNYVSGILGMAEIIEENSHNLGKLKSDTEAFNAENKQIIKYSQMIKSEANTMLKFSESLIESRGIEDRMKELKLKNESNNIDEIDIKELIEELILFKKPFINQHQVILKTEISENILPLRSKLIGVRRIIDNLFTNAIKYSFKDGQIVIKAEKSDLEEYDLYLEISDNGIGMSPEEVEKSFAGQGKEIDKSDLGKGFESHGLGLPIVKQAIKDLSAKIEVESTKGQGTIFRIWLKSSIRTNEVANYALQNSLPIEVEDKKIQSKTIIIADDDNLILISTKYQLSKLGFNVLTASNGTEVLKILNANDCDLILMDINMDFEDEGPQTTRKIREGEGLGNSQKHQNIPIIAISANFDQASKDLALQSGMNDYLEKPFSKNRFLIKFNKLFAQS